MFVVAAREEAASGALRQRLAGSDDRIDSAAARGGRSDGNNTFNESRASVPLAKTGQLWRDLDEFQESLESDLQLNTVAIGSVGTIVSGFTVGYVLWVVRSGLLLSSVLASLPAWTMFDPMVILPVSGARDDGQEESLEQIVENQTALAASRQRQERETEPSP